jgi:hypothetical protein
MYRVSLWKFFLIHQCIYVHHHFSMRWLDVLFPATRLRVPNVGSVESCLKNCCNSKAMQFYVPTSQPSIGWGTWLCSLKVSKSINLRHIVWYPMRCPVVCISLFITSDTVSKCVYIPLRRFKLKRLKSLFTVLNDVVMPCCTRKYSIISRVLL